MKKTTKIAKKTTKLTKKRVPIKHVRHILRITPKFIHGMVVGAFVGLLVVSVLRMQHTAQALSLSVTRNCDDNAVIYCGALTTAELQQRYGNAGVATIYSYFGITAKDIQDINSIAVVGSVTKAGLVIVNGKTVATGALTVGRQDISGSRHEDVNGVNFYIRAPAVSFLSDSIPAYVAFNDSGQFIFAILGSCGNAASATAVPQSSPKPTPTPTPMPTAPTSPLAPTILTTPQPVVTTAAMHTSSSLPDTGPGAVVIIAALSVIGGYVFHATHRHVRSKRRQHHALHHTR
jgi:hypothetical protein